MKFDKEHWKEIDVNIDSLWIIGPRATGGNDPTAIMEILLHKYRIILFVDIQKKVILYLICLWAAAPHFMSARHSKEILSVSTSIKILSILSKTEWKTQKTSSLQYIIAI